MCCSRRGTRAQLAQQLTDEMVGFGPLEPLLRDEFDQRHHGQRTGYSVRRGARQAEAVRRAVPRRGARLPWSRQRIVAAIGRRIDESSPLCRRAPAGRQPRQRDHPAAGAGRTQHLDPQILQEDSSISQHWWRNGSMSPAIARLLEIAARCRLNILISGGTGSGKTTLLNALSAA